MKTKTVYVVEFQDSWGIWVQTPPLFKSVRAAKHFMDAQRIRTNSIIKYRIIKRTEEIVYE